MGKEIVHAEKTVHYFSALPIMNAFRSSRRTYAILYQLNAQGSFL